VTEPVRALGVDAAGRHGWVGVIVDEHGFVDARLGALAALVEWAEPVAAVGVDIPIGSVPGGPRQADDLARRALGPRRASLFAAPPAEVLDAATYGEANQRLAAAGRPLLSRQAWGLVPKMVEALAVAEHDPRVVEVHPELSFAAMAGAPLPWSKKSWNGLLLRRRLLAEAGIQLADDLEQVGAAVPDDVVDAAAAAWSARRHARGTARPLPDPPEQADGRSVAIWC
jgi:predicted RNase H-like nuclease